MRLVLRMKNVLCAGSLVYVKESFGVSSYIALLMNDVPIKTRGEISYIVLRASDEHLNLKHLIHVIHVNECEVLYER